MTTPRKDPRGGPRGGGRPKGSVTGRTVETVSITLPPALREKLDTLRGDQSRGQWVAERIRRAKT